MKKLIYMIVICLGIAQEIKSSQESVAPQQNKSIAGRIAFTKMIDTIEDSTLDADTRYEEIAAQLNKHPDIINMRDAYGNTALMHAALRGSTRIVRLLLAQGADSNIKNFAGDTALMLAAANENIYTMMRFVEHGVNNSHLDLQNNEGFTALMTAASKLKFPAQSDPNEMTEKEMSIALLVGAGADLNIKNSKDGNKTARDYAEDKNAFDAAVYVGAVEVSQKIKESEKKEREEKLESQNIEELNQALLHAAAHDNFYEALSLVANGANIMVVDAWDQNILMLAARNLNSIFILELALEGSISSAEKKALAQAKNIHGDTALTLLLQHDIVSRNRGTIKKLEQLKNKKLVAQEREKISEDIKAIKEKQQRILGVLLRSPFDSDINAKTKNGMTPLMIAVANDIKQHTAYKAVELEVRDVRYY